jgi:hypothetical protein
VCSDARDKGLSIDSFEVSAGVYMRDSFLLVYEAAPMGNPIPTFRSNVTSLSPMVE